MVQYYTLLVSLLHGWTGTYTLSTTVSIPSGCGHINIFCVGGGCCGQEYTGTSSGYQNGGCSGYTLKL